MTLSCQAPSRWAIRSRVPTTRQPQRAWSARLAVLPARIEVWIVQIPCSARRRDEGLEERCADATPARRRVDVDAVLDDARGSRPAATSGSRPSSRRRRRPRPRRGGEQGDAVRPTSPSRGRRSRTRRRRLRGRPGRSRATSGQSAGSSARIAARRNSTPGTARALPAHGLQGRATMGSCEAPSPSVPRPGRGRGDRPHARGPRRGPRRRGGRERHGRARFGSPSQASTSPPTSGSRSPAGSRSATRTSVSRAGPRGSTCGSRRGAPTAAAEALLAFGEVRAAERLPAGAACRVGARPDDDALVGLLAGGGYRHVRELVRDGAGVDRRRPRRRLRRAGRDGARGAGRERRGDHPCGARGGVRGALGVPPENARGVAGVEPRARRRDRALA